MTPIEIAGERIEEADIPEAAWCRVSSGSIGFYDVAKLDDSRFYYVIARTRCHFLDKAAAMMKSQADDGIVNCDDYCECDQRQIYKAYLASAAKWARVGRAVKS